MQNFFWKKSRANFQAPDELAQLAQLLFERDRLAACSPHEGPDLATYAFNLWQSGNTIEKTKEINCRAVAGPLSLARLRG